MENNKNLGLYIGIAGVVLAIIVGMTAYSMGKKAGQNTPSNTLATNTPAADATTTASGAVLGTDTGITSMLAAAGGFPHFVDTSYSLTREKHTGFINDVYQKDGFTYLDIDYVQNYGKCSIDTLPDECMNGVKIIPNDSQVRTFSVVGNAVITTKTYNLARVVQIIPLSTFMNLVDTVSGPYMASQIPFTIELQNGVIISITEEYFPQ